MVVRAGVRRTRRALVAAVLAVAVVGGCSRPPAPVVESQAPSPVVTTSAAPSRALDSEPAGQGTTGVPAGTALTAYTGPTTITRPGTVIDRQEITGCLVIKADDVTISSSLIRSACLFNVLADEGHTGLRLVDVEIDGLGNTDGDSAVNGGGYTCLRCDVHGTTDGFKAGNDVTITDSWIHDLAMTKDSHNDGIQSLGTNRLTVEGTTIVLADGATSAVILSTGSASEMRNVTITHNVLGGGAFTVYGGYSAGEDDVSKVSGILIADNRFSTRIHPKSGVYGAMTSTDPPVVVGRNTWFDGPKAGEALE